MLKIKYFNAILTVSFLTILIANPVSVTSFEEERNFNDEILITHSRPGETRAELEIPPGITSRICEKVGFKNDVMGYTPEEMAHFIGDKHCLRLIKNLFRDIESVPRFSGRISDTFVESHDNTSLLATYCFSMLDARPGFEFKELMENNWGVSWIPDGTIPKDALRLLIEHEADDDNSKPVNPEYMRIFNELPEAIQRFTIRMMVGSILASEQIKKAFDDEYLKNLMDGEGSDRAKLYDLLTAPWGDSEPEPSSFKAMDRIDLAYLAYGSIIYLNHSQNAIKELKLSLPQMDLTKCDFESISFDTPSGKILICGTGDNEISGNYDLVIDLGGNDKYTGNTASPKSLDYPINVVFDLDGNDTYGDNEKTSRIACGFMGLGGIFDLKGNDTYLCHKAGIGYGCYGTGIVEDFEGADKYFIEDAWGQGAAQVGLGMLIDISGDDEYSCGAESQGFGSTLGVGLILDIAGNDSYKASDTSHLSELFGNKAISFAQGTGYGRRADFGDGHSLAGGIGILVDGSGDDSYYGSIYSQGAGYWWSMGILEDKGGNDTYRCLMYSLGSAPHFAIGCTVDSKGNDKYNVDSKDVITQYQGCARDGSFGIFIDGDGDDHYMFRNRCSGSGDLNSIALFWDRYGNDIYDTNLSPPYEKDPPMGASTYYDPFRTFRDYMLTSGVFLDTSGLDLYNIDSGEYNGKKPDAKENSEWLFDAGTYFRGYGFDWNWYD